MKGPLAAEHGEEGGPSDGADGVYRVRRPGARA